MAIMDRALGGSKARKLRAVLPERALNGEKVALTEVIYFVSISDIANKAWDLFYTDVWELKEDPNCS